MYFYVTKLLAYGFVSLISILFQNVVINFAYVKPNSHMTVDKRSRSNLPEGKQPWAE